MVTCGQSKRNSACPPGEGSSTRTRWIGIEGTVRTNLFVRTYVRTNRTEKSDNPNRCVHFAMR